MVSRDVAPFIVDDDRFPLNPGETPEITSVRFRTLGCYPLTGGVPSEAGSVAEIIAELATNTRSERSGRTIDGEGAASMERKKAEGYF